MIILSTVTSEQSFVFIPRSHTFDYIGITDDQTNEAIQISSYNHVIGDYYDTISTEFKLTENHFYDLVIKNGDLVVYKDRIFCTDQEIVNFSVNNGQYVSSSTANTFIVYE